ncbi:REST corepressor 3 isoform X2 [Copidosoma floridanum]|uniref:REST corepressor 3 isoform X2 n=1 Tax=Copidosoma floridanum TaxID=29053 RepID=UPI0006C9CD9A|nr:REST corepressor 3 isoform X2 [Copidosoma floridanum]
MVLAERNSENVRNGRRSRGPSPNGQTDTSSEEDGVPAEKIRVGRDFQVSVPELIPIGDRKLDLCPEKALLVWSPTTDIPEQKLEDYISLAKEKYGYNGEQALGMLFWHKHNLERAESDLANFTPFPDEWTVEDKVLFEQAFQFHGKSFHRIRQMLPDKSIASLVKYYYSWKKTRTKTSLMDRQARKLTTSGKEGENGSDNGSELGSSDSDQDDKGSCSNCGVACHNVRATPKGHACHSCYLHWRRTGVARPLSSMPGRSNKRKPPRGLVVNHDDLAALAGQTSQASNVLQAIDTEIVSLKRQIQSNKQQVSALKRKTNDGIEELRPSENASRITSRWTNDELLLAVQGVRKYGKDFSAIADVIGTKTEAHLRSFFVNYRRRYNLDAVLKEYEAENGPILIEDDKEDKMEIDQPMITESAESSQKAKSPVVTNQTSK